MAAGAALVLLVPRFRDRMIGAVVVAVGAGLAFTALLQFWIGAVDGPYWRMAGVFALGIGAVAVVVLGLESLLGRPGLALGAALMIVLGNPLSGLTGAPELLPSGWGTLGQLLPPGATGTLLRDVAFFDGAAAGRPLAVLACWLVAGLALAAVAGLRSRRTPVAPAEPCPSRPWGERRDCDRGAQTRLRNRSPNARERPGRSRHSPSAGARGGGGRRGCPRRR